MCGPAVDITAAMAGQHYCLRWNNYQSNMTSVFHQLLQTEAFVDVTLSCNEASLKAHKVVLSACSSYFQKLLLENPCKHPTIIMPPDVCFNDLKFIIEFVYRGEIDVSQAELQSLLKTADQLKIKGLCELPEGREGGVGISSAEVTPLPPNVRRRNITKFRRFAGNKGRRFEPHRGRPPLFRGAATVKQEQPQQSPQQHQQQHHQQQHQQQQQVLQQQQQMQHAQHQQHQMQHQTHLQQGAGIAEPMRHIQVANGMAVNVGMTVATSTDEEHSSGGHLSAGDIPVVILESRPHSHGHAGQPQMHPHLQHHQLTTAVSPVLLSHQGHLPHGLSLPPPQPQQMEQHNSHSVHSGHSAHSAHSNSASDVEMPPEVTPPAPSATPVPLMAIHEESIPRSRDMAVDTSGITHTTEDENVKVKFETLRAMEQGDTLNMDSHMTDRQPQNMGDEDHTMHTMMITPELLGLIPSSSGHSTDSTAPSPADVTPETPKGPGGPKTWTQEDMDAALDALRTQNISLTKAATMFNIPSTTLWQRAHRLGIDTPKKEGPNKSWSEDNLNNALEALRSGSISANKASKAYGIPSSTLYKIARREGIRLAAPFNAAPTTWNPDDLERALESIRSGQTSVQRAAAEFGIPTGTLYGRCKREGIELSRSTPTPWSEDAMLEALESVRVGQMSINQAAIHYNLPYSSLYGRFKRGKYEADHPSGDESMDAPVSPNIQPQIMVLPYSVSVTQHSQQQHQQTAQQQAQAAAAQQQAQQQAAQAQQAQQQAQQAAAAQQAAQQQAQQAAQQQAQQAAQQQAQQAAAQQAAAQQAAAQQAAQQAAAQQAAQQQAQQVAAQQAQQQQQQQQQAAAQQAQAAAHQIHQQQQAAAQAAQAAQAQHSMAQYQSHSTS
ncbi:protein bric-a-brac 1-like isoform X3 [Thrips palmi]|nr:protein bric-a-brac 1-like isoform X3 [Thrips palmi]XP_034249666.1 protein bric-a-brac 1-like isoform X3 [Thrips palmi]